MLQLNVIVVSRSLIRGRFSVTTVYVDRNVMIIVVMNDYTTFRQLPTVARQSTVP